MPVYIALLRGINVGGRKKILMADLKQSCERCGFEQVQTYVQSGNLVFQSSKGSSEAVSRQIEAAVRKDFGFEVSAIARSAREMEKLRSDNPFLKTADPDTGKLHVIFLSSPPPPEGVKKLAGFAAPGEQFHCGEREIYLYLPNGFGRSKLAAAPFERLLGVRATARNWNTVTKLCEISSACG